MSSEIMLTVLTPEGTLIHRDLSFTKATEVLKQAVEGGHGSVLVQLQGTEHPVAADSDLKPVIVAGSNGRPMVGWVTPDVADAIEAAIGQDPVAEPMEHSD